VGESKQPLAQLSVGCYLGRAVSFQDGGISPGGPLHGHRKILRSNRWARTVVKLIEIEGLPENQTAVCRLRSVNAGEGGVGQYCAQMTESQECISQVSSLNEYQPGFCFPGQRGAWVNGGSGSASTLTERDRSIEGDRVNDAQLGSWDRRGIGSFWAFWCCSVWSTLGVGCPGRPASSVPSAWLLRVPPPQRPRGFETNFRGYWGFAGTTGGRREDRRRRRGPGENKGLV
jgi:hypothetical protein